MVFIKKVLSVGYRLFIYINIKNGILKYGKNLIKWFYKQFDCVMNFLKVKGYIVYNIFYFKV